MAAKASGDSSKVPKIATLFISAHSLEFPDIPVNIEVKDPSTPANIEVRLVNSQKVCGRHNFESPESICNKLDYWTDVFKHRYIKNSAKKKSKKKVAETTYDVLERGVKEFNTLIVPRKSIAETWRPMGIKDRYNYPFTIKNTNQSSYYNGILKRLTELVSSKENIEKFIEILTDELDIDPSVITDIMQLIQESKNGITFMQEIAVLGLESGVDISPNDLLYALNKWKSHALEDIHDEQTNFSSIDPVLHEKQYVFLPNSDEKDEDVLGSFYGIHIIQNSEEEDAIHEYEDDEHVTYDNLISGTFEFTLPNLDDPDGKGRKFTIKSSRKEKELTPFMNRAIEYFMSLINLDRKSKLYKYTHTITLTEIVTFFHSEGYDVLNIIDTGCRNFDADKTRHWDDITVIDKMRGISKKKYSVLREHPFSKGLGQKRRSKMRRRI
jgi:hypothetical protein